LKLRARGESHETMAATNRILGRCIRGAHLVASHPSSSVDSALNIFQECRRTHVAVETR
jgi:hypothetical protein